MDIFINILGERRKPPEQQIVNRLRVTRLTRAPTTSENLHDDGTEMMILLIFLWRSLPFANYQKRRNEKTPTCQGDGSKFLVVVVLAVIVYCITATQIPESYCDWIGKKKANLVMDRDKCQVGNDISWPWIHQKERPLCVRKSFVSSYRQRSLHYKNKHPTQEDECCSSCLLILLVLSQK